MSDTDSGFGLDHLPEVPITTGFSITLLGVLIVLVLLRLLFADVGGNIGVSAGARGGGGVK